MATTEATDEPVTLSEYDLALDLFGWCPRPKRVCPRCGDLAEPFMVGSCWLCCAIAGMVPTVPTVDAPLPSEGHR